jgi:hypothetical protein
MGVGLCFAPNVEKIVLGKWIPDSMPGSEALSTVEVETLRVVFDDMQRNIELDAKKLGFKSAREMLTKLMGEDFVEKLKKFVINIDKTSEDAILEKEYQIHTSDIYYKYTDSLLCAKKLPLCEVVQRKLKTMSQANARLHINPNEFLYIVNGINEAHAKAEEFTDELKIKQTTEACNQNNLQIYGGLIGPHTMEMTSMSGGGLGGGATWNFEKGMHNFEISAAVGSGLRIYSDSTPFDIFPLKVAEDKPEDDSGKETSGVVAEEDEPSYDMRMGVQVLPDGVPLRPHVTNDGNAHLFWDGGAQYSIRTNNWLSLLATVGASQNCDTLHGVVSGTWRQKSFCIWRP